MESVQKYLKITGRFRKGLRNSSVSQGFAKFLLACENFASGCEILHFRKPCEITSGLRKFHKGLRNSPMLDSFSDSLPCILDWFGKGFEALQNLDSSCNLASILLCHGLYQVLPHSLLVLMIKKLPKAPKLAKNWLVTLVRVLNVPIELKGNKYYSKVFKKSL